MRSAALLVGLLVLALPARANAQAPAGPVVVVPVAGAGIDPAAVAPIAARVTDTLSERVQGRQVRRVSDPARLEAIAECPGPDCLATEVRDEGAALAVLVHLSAAVPDGEEEGNGSADDGDGEDGDPADDGSADGEDDDAAATLTVGLRAVDVTGAPQGTPLEVEITGTDDEALAALDGPVSQLATMLPAPPPESSLLLAINVDDAQVRVDGQSVGASPLAPLDLEPGEHPVSVSKDGFASVRQTVRVKVGEASRLDVDLTPDAGTRERLAAEDEGRPTASTPIWERWYFWAAVGGVVALTLIGGAVAAASGNGGGGGGGDAFPVPEIQP